MMTRVGDDFSHKVSTVVLLSRCRCLANGGRLGICSVFRGPLDPHVWTRITFGTATDKVPTCSLQLRSCISSCHGTCPSHGLAHWVR